MSKVEQYISDLIEKEGGYVNHPSDRGGPTCWGITEAVARAFGYTGPMQNLSKDTARQIYLERYWLQPKFDQVNQISPKIAEEMFDTGVNMGAAVAGKFLQRALNVLNQRGQIYPDLAVDGGIGKMTLYALQTLLKARPSAEDVIWKMLNSQQSVRYMEIAEANQTQEDFQFGWQRARVGM